MCKEFTIPYEELSMQVQELYIHYGKLPIDLGVLRITLQKAGIALL